MLKVWGASDPIFDASIANGVLDSGSAAGRD